MGNDSGAIDNFDRALSIDPDNTDSLINKAAAIGHLQKYEDAFVLLNKALSISPNDTESLSVRAIMSYEIGNKENAKTDVDRVLQIDPNDTYAMELSMRLDLPRHR
jgi:Tfp pilus assembly protein PilF